MAYTAAKIEQAAQLLIKALPGLHIEVARAWVTAEQGDNNNVLGLTDANHVLYKYPTLAAGITANAKWVLNPASPYGGIRASLKGGSIAVQGKAIIASGWNVRNSPYYTRIFTAMGLFKAVTPPVKETTLDLSPLKPVDMSGPSPDTNIYVQQLFTIQQSNPKLAGLWPSEATVPSQRQMTLVQFVASIVGSGPYYNHTEPLLTCEQVIWAHEHNLANYNLNPVYAAALDRAARVAGNVKTGALPWNFTGDTSLYLEPTGSFGTTPVSGYYGTGKGSVHA